MRDDFTKSVKDTLAKRVGTRCSNPGCRKPTTGPHHSSDRVVNIGVAAHITAATSGGPRFDPGMSPGERRSEDNGIWLCQSCAKLIDSDFNRYPIETVMEWKRSSEVLLQQQLEGRASEVEPPEDLIELDLFYETENISLRDDRHDYRLVVVVKNLSEEILHEYHLDLEVPVRVVENPETLGRYERSRSTDEVAFFRVPSQGDVFPGDTKPLIRLPYFMDNGIFWDKRGLFEKHVRATLFRPSKPRLVVEKEFQDLQCF